MSKLKIYVHYEDADDESKSMKLKIVVPRKWKTEPCSRITKFFVDAYNKKHADKPLVLEKCRILKKSGPPLDGNVVEKCLQKYDDLYVRIKSSSTPTPSSFTSAPPLPTTHTTTTTTTTTTRKKDFDTKYNKWNNLVCSSDDDEDCHPNIEKYTWRRLRKQQREDERQKQESRLNELKDQTKLREAEIADAELVLKSAEKGGTKYRRAEEEIAKARKAIESYVKEEKSIHKRMKKTLEDVCTFTEERTMMNDDVSVKPVPTVVSKDNEAKALESFIQNHDNKLVEYMSYARRTYRDNREFLTKHPELLCEQCTGWLLLRALEAEMGGDTMRMKDIVKQYLQLQTVIDLARSTQKDPRDYIVRFFGNMERDHKNVEKFMIEVEDFSKKIQGRAVEKKKEEEKKKKMAEELGLDTQDGKYEYVELSKEERLGPGGLDPIEVFKSLPEEMRQAFDKQDIPLLQKVLENLPKEEAAYHMKRCADSGLWVPNGGAADDDNDDDDNVVV